MLPKEAKSAILSMALVSQQECNHIIRFTGDMYADCLRYR